MVKKLDPDLVSLICKDLTTKGRSSDIPRFLNTYNKSNGDITAPVPSGARVMSTATLSGAGHIQGIGWRQNPYGTGTVLLGTTGEHRNLEAFVLSFDNPSYTSRLSYEAHVQSIGWQGVRPGGAEAGTTGQHRRIEAVKIYFQGEPYNFISYRAHCSGLGWLSWVSSGNQAGTTGQNRAVEAIEVRPLQYSDPF